MSKPKIYPVGLRVKAAKDLSRGLNVRKGDLGTVSSVFLAYDTEDTLDGLTETYPYDVVFDGNDHEIPVDRDEIEDARSFWDRWFSRKNKGPGYVPILDAERHFGTEETAQAFQQVQETGTPVNVKGE